LCFREETPPAASVSHKTSMDTTFQAVDLESVLYREMVDRGVRYTR
jgi:hypothetical protein